MGEQNGKRPFLNKIPYPRCQGRPTQEGGNERITPGSGQCFKDIGWCCCAFVLYNLGYRQN
eukprot:821979-Amphidinium_carterae.1